MKELIKKRRVKESGTLLDNTNEEAFEVEKRKVVRVSWIPSIILFIILCLEGYWCINLFSTTSKPEHYIGTVPIDKVTFIDACKFNELIVDDGVLTRARSKEMDYEIIYAKFKTREEANKAFNKFIETAEEVETSYSFHTALDNSKKRILVSNKYNGLVVEALIENTIVTGVAYNTNRYKNVVKIMRDLGY